MAGRRSQIFRATRENGVPVKFFCQLVLDPPPFTPPQENKRASLEPLYGGHSTEEKEELLPMPRAIKNFMDRVYYLQDSWKV